MKEGWEYKKLGEIVHIGLGFTHTPEYVEEGIPFLSVKDISRGNIIWENIKYISKEEYIAAPTGAKPKKGDILFCRVGTMGKPIIIDFEFPFCTFVSLGYLRLKNNEVFNKYIKNWMESDSFKTQVEKNVKGGTIKNLNTGWLKNFDIPVPPLSEQKRIVEELDLLSGIIEKQKQQLKELDTLAQSVFYDMFGDPVTNEKGWEVKKMKEVAPSKEFIGEITKVKNKYWLLNLDKVESHTGKILSKDYYDSNEIGSSTITFDENNVLYSKLRPYLNKVVIPNDTGYATSELVPLKPDYKILNRIFLAYLLRSANFVSYISIKVVGTKMPRVSMEELRNFKVILPPLPLQILFASKIEAIEKQKEGVSKSIEETQKLFDYTMDKYFG